MKRIALVCMMVMMALAAYAELPKIAVMDFTSTEIHRQYGVKAAELVRLNLINSKEYTVIMKSQTTRALAAQGIQLDACFSIDCAARAGRILGASRVVTGTMMKTGANVILTGVVVDVATGASEYSESSTAPGIDDMNDAAVKLSKKLSRRLEKAVEKDAARDRKKGGKIDKKGEKITQGSGNVTVKEFIKKFGLAVGTSAFPVWSGSFVRGFDAGGLTFTVLKSSSAACVVYYYGFFKPGYEKYYDNKKKSQKTKEAIYVSFGAPVLFRLILLHNSAEPRSIDQYSRDYDKAFMYIGIIGLPVFTIVDMIYSGFMVSRHYSNIAAIPGGGAGTISWHAAPRFYETERIFHRNGETVTAHMAGIDGANVGVSYQF